MAKSSKGRAKEPTKRTNIIKGTVSGIAIQDSQGNIKINQQIGTSTKELSALFEQVYAYLAQREENKDVEKGEIEAIVKNIQEESSKGNAANRTKLERWLKYLNEIAPDIIDVILACLGGPVPGFAAVLKKIAKRAQTQTSHP